LKQRQEFLSAAGNRQRIGHLRQNPYARVQPIRQSPGNGLCPRVRFIVLKQQRDEKERVGELGAHLRGAP
jgi:hypothetical protein